MGAQGDLGGRVRRCADVLNRAADHVGHGLAVGDDPLFHHRLGHREVDAGSVAWAEHTSFPKALGRHHRHVTKEGKAQEGLDSHLPHGRLCLLSPFNTMSEARLSLRGEWGFYGGISPSRTKSGQRSNSCGKAVPQSCDQLGVVLLRVPGHRGWGGGTEIKV